MEIMECAENLGVDFAFPTWTAHIDTARLSSDKPDAYRSRHQLAPAHDCLRNQAADP